MLYTNKYIEIYKISLNKIKVMDRHATNKVERSQELSKSTASNDINKKCRVKRINAHDSSRKFTCIFKGRHGLFRNLIPGLETMLWIIVMVKIKFKLPLQTVLLLRHIGVIFY